MALLELEEFEGWLRGKRPDDVIGEVGMPESCPIALFLLQEKHIEATVETDVIFLSEPEDDSDSGYVVLPAWARFFVNNIDGSELEDTAGDLVFADDAVVALEEAKQQVDNYRVV